MILFQHLVHPDFAMFELVFAKLVLDRFGANATEKSSFQSPKSPTIAEIVDIRVSATVAPIWEAFVAHIIPSESLVRTSVTHACSVIIVATV